MSSYFHRRDPHGRGATARATVASRLAARRAPRGARKVAGTRLHRRVRSRGGRSVATTRPHGALGWFRRLRMLSQETPASRHHGLRSAPQLVRATARPGGRPWYCNFAPAGPLPCGSALETGRCTRGPSSTYRVLVARGGCADPSSLRTAGDRQPVRRTMVWRRARKRRSPRSARRSRPPPFMSIRECPINAVGAPHRPCHHDTSASPSDTPG